MSDQAAPNPFSREIDRPGFGSCAMPRSTSLRISRRLLCLGPPAHAGQQTNRPGSHGPDPDGQHGPESPGPPVCFGEVCRLRFTADQPWGKHSRVARNDRPVIGIHCNRRARHSDPLTPIRGRVRISNRDSLSGPVGLSAVCTAFGLRSMIRKYARNAVSVRRRACSQFLQ